jgi:proteasome lid subunit RPN8/RPN11
MSSQKARRRQLAALGSVVAPRPAASPLVESADADTVDDTLIPRIAFHPPAGHNLLFSRLVWEKFVWMRDYGNVEVGGFAVTSPDDPLYILDFELVKQTVTSGSIDFDDNSMIDRMTRRGIDNGEDPETYQRIWIHTHPGQSADPSTVDYETFNKCYKAEPWAVMLILAKGGEVTASLRYNGAKFGVVTTQLGVHVEPWPDTPVLLPIPAWIEEYNANVRRRPITTQYTVTSYSGDSGGAGFRADRSQHIFGPGHVFVPPFSMLEIESMDSSELRRCYPHMIDWHKTIARRRLTEEFREGTAGLDNANHLSEYTFD